MLRDILSEHQMYYHSVKRMVYKPEIRLITKQALEAMAVAKQSTGDDKKVKIPSVTYLIDELVMFAFQGTKMLLIAFENQSVQVFESGNGHFVYEFSFYDNVIDQFKSNNQVNKLQAEKEEKELQAEFKKSGYQSRTEFNFNKRKVLREKKEYVPKIPEFTTASDVQRAKKGSD